MPDNKSPFSNPLDNQQPQNEGSEKKPFSTGFVKAQIEQLLGSVELIKTVRSVEVTINAQNQMRLDLAITAKGFDVGVTATLENDGNSLTVKDHKVQANFLARGFAESAIKPHLDNVSKLLKDYIEKTENKKVLKIEIKNGQLEVAFEKDASAQTRPVQEEESLTVQETITPTPATKEFEMIGKAREYFDNTFKKRSADINVWFYASEAVVDGFLGRDIKGILTQEEIQEAFDLTTDNEGNFEKVTIKNPEKWHALLDKVLKHFEEKRGAEKKIKDAVENNLTGAEKPNFKNEQKFDLYTSLPNGDIFSRISHQFVEEDAFFGITVDKNNPNKGTFNLINHGIGLDMVLNSHELIMSSAYISGTVSVPPTKDNYVIYSLGEIEQIKPGVWQITKKMGYGWGPDAYPKSFLEKEEAKKVDAHKKATETSENKKTFPEQMKSIRDMLEKLIPKLSESGIKEEFYRRKSMPYLLSMGTSTSFADILEIFEGGAKEGIQEKIDLLNDLEKALAEILIEEEQKKSVVAQTGNTVAIDKPKETKEGTISYPRAEVEEKVKQLLKAKGLELKDWEMIPWVFPTFATLDGDVAADIEMHFDLADGSTAKYSAKEFFANELNKKVSGVTIEEGNYIVTLEKENKDQTTSAKARPAQKAELATPEVTEEWYTKKLNEFLENTGEFSVKDLMILVSLKKPEADKIIAELLQKGRIVKRAGGRYQVREKLEHFETDGVTELEEVVLDEEAGPADTADKEKETQKSAKEIELEKLEERNRQIDEMRAALLKKLEEIEKNKK